MLTLDHVRMVYDVRRLCERLQYSEFWPETRLGVDLDKPNTWAELLACLSAGLYENYLASPISTCRLPSDSTDNPMRLELLPDPVQVANIPASLKTFPYDAGSCDVAYILTAPLWRWEKFMRTMSIDMGRIWFGADFAQSRTLFMSLLTEELQHAAARIMLTAEDTERKQTDVVQDCESKLMGILWSCLDTASIVRHVLAQRNAYSSDLVTLCDRLNQPQT